MKLRLLPKLYVHKWDKQYVVQLGNDLGVDFVFEMGPDFLGGGGEEVG